LERNRFKISEKTVENSLLYIAVAKENSGKESDCYLKGNVAENSGEKSLENNGNHKKGKRNFAWDTGYLAVIFRFPSM
jgi:hypothetical protein